jgi:hypothetical protein
MHSTTLRPPLNVHLSRQSANFLQCRIFQAAKDYAAAIAEFTGKAPSTSGMASRANFFDKARRKQPGPGAGRVKREVLAEQDREWPAQLRRHALDPPLACCQCPEQRILVRPSPLHARSVIL